VTIERAPEFDANWKVFDELVAYTRELVGDAGTFDLGYPIESIGVLQVTPLNPLACPINIISEQFLIVTIGSIGGRWELDYSEADQETARHIVEAAVAGRVTETRALARSRVTATLADGRTIHETGYDGCLPLLVPQPGWTRWAPRTNSEPY
jgi:hypothetical protein